MLTRRTVLGAGLAFTAVGCTPALVAYQATSRRRPQARAIDALLIDETIEMPRKMATFIEARRRSLPVFGIQLDAPSYAGLMGILDSSQGIVGISSGATLFCIERLAWDHGFRLVARSHRRADDSGDDADSRDVAALLSGTPLLAADPSLAVRDYRPSRADGTLHVWAMQKPAGPQLHRGPREA